MCQAYEGERGIVDLIRDRERREGRPGGCDFQAGYYQCPNRFRRESIYLAFNPRTGHRAWRCRDCGTEYPYRETD